MIAWATATTTTHTTYVAGGSSYYNWKFTSNHSTTAMTDCQWNYVTPATGVTIPMKYTVLDQQERTANGYVSVAYLGSTVYNNRRIVVHKLRDTGTVVTIVND